MERGYSCSLVGATLRYLMYHLPSIFTRSSTPWPAAAILGAVGLLSAPPVPNTVWGQVESGMEHVDALPKGEPPREPGKIVKATVG